MKKYLSGISTGAGYGIPDSQSIPLIAEAGFDSFFTGWSDNYDVAASAKLGKECGLIYSSIHAPFGKVHKLWEEGTEGDSVADEQIRCLRGCAENGVPVMVAHPIIGMDRHTPNGIGIERFARILAEAERCGVKVAIENVEGIEYLLMIRDELSSFSSLGFCWDTGHEMCYNASADVPAMFEGRLIYTHINDNLRQTDPNVVTWLDDSHLMPFDGLADWQGIADRLDRENYTGIMTYELTSKSKPGKHTHDIYDGLSAGDFFRLAREKHEKLLSMRKPPSA